MGNKENKYQYTVEDIKQLIDAGVIVNLKYTDEELLFFARFCEQQRLDPWNKEAHLTRDKYGKLFTMTSYHIFFRRAQESGTFGGLDDIRYNERVDPKTGTLLYNSKAELLVSNKLPLTAHCTMYVLRAGQRCPVTVSIVVAEYNRNNHMWNGKTFTMIDKVAKAHAARHAFPSEVGGLYIEEEEGAFMEDTVAATDVNAARAPQAAKQNGGGVPTAEQLDANELADQLASATELVRECLEQTEPGHCTAALQKLWDTHAPEWAKSTDIKRLVSTVRQQSEAIDSIQRCLEDGEPGSQVADLQKLWDKNEALWSKDKVILQAVKVAKETATGIDANAKKPVTND